MLRSEERFCAGLRASSFLLCLALSVSFTPPPTGEGLGIVFLGFVGFTLLVHRRLTLAQQGLFGTLSVSFPTRFTKSNTGLTRAFPVSFILPLWGKAGLTSQLVPANLHEFAHNRLTQRQQGLFGASLVLLPSSFPKTAHRATQSRVWFSPLFPGALWVWQSYQIPLQLVFHCFLGGSDRVTQIPVPHQACLCFYLRRFRINESLLFKLPNVLGNRVSAHSCVLADPSNAGPALVGFPVLAEHQVSINRQFAGA